MRLATWNINSIRARADRAVAWLERTGTDVLALQETKCADAQFPYSVFEAAGYEVVHVGSSQWNGVAIAARVGLADVRTHFAGQPSFGDPNPVVEARALGLLQGQHVGPGALQPGDRAVRARPDRVDVPCGEPHRTTLPATGDT